MATLTIENIPDDLLERLRRSATAHGRSLSGEVVEQLRQSPTASPKEPRPPINPQKLIEELREMRSRFAHLPRLTDEFLEYAKNERRP